MASANPYAEIKDTKKAYQHAYYLRNKEHILAKNKANAPKYKERKNAKSREFYANNKEIVCARGEKWRKAHKDEHNLRVREWQKKNPESVKRSKRKAVLKAQYGISVEDFDSMAASQGFACAICKLVPIKTLHVDHCHKTNKIRGLLCSQCNTAIGLLKENAEFLSRAITYLSV